MRQTLFPLVLVCLVNVAFGQVNKETLTAINDQVQIIDGYSDSEVFTLDPEEFLDRMADHGAELNGYYEHERLKKIVRKVGYRTADILTTFYFWNDELIHVIYQHRPYFETTAANGQKVYDYGTTYVAFESKHYIDNGKEIKKETSGKPLADVKPETAFVKYATKMKSLLDNKYYNKETYQALQGKWLFVQSTNDYIVFDGTIRFNFYNGKFRNRLKTKIEDGVLTCWVPMDERIYQYKIVEVTEDVLTLTDLFTKEELVYAKIE
ncbi:hypothetical protein [Aquimarina brevivitae]|uniref:DUF3108 domain-containing protein n=1 Tax=Aquimarina brevivitae TaxID=323412 RepID=A0A4Q7P0H1_9FLAO|nr:hypothetical protein [Aquimarina brevivitae]RZS93154.1 hypothetical protein EV197_1724 [Aquimarina brevivitae]